MSRFFVIERKTEQVDPNFSQVHLYEFDELRPHMTETSRILLDFSSFAEQPETEIKYDQPQWPDNDDEQDQDEGDEGDEAEEDEEDEEKENFRALYQYQGPLSD